MAEKSTMAVDNAEPITTMKLLSADFDEARALDSLSGIHDGVL